MGTLRALTHLRAPCHLAHPLPATVAGARIACHQRGDALMPPTVFESDVYGPARVRDNQIMIR